MRSILGLKLQQKKICSILQKKDWRRHFRLHGDLVNPQEMAQFIISTKTKEWFKKSILAMIITKIMFKDRDYNLLKGKKKSSAQCLRNNKTFKLSNN